MGVHTLPPRPPGMLLRGGRDGMDHRPRGLEVAAVGYADDRYPIGQTTEQLEAPMAMTADWLVDTGQESSASESLSFEVTDPAPVPVALGGDALLQKHTVSLT